MSQPRILLVDSNQSRAQSIRDAISGALLIQSAVRHDGESAVLWVGANDCDLCILSYELPGLDGLEALVRMRNRKPNLPTIMLAESREQHVAITAFREGVLDFVPAYGRFQQIIAERVQEIIVNAAPTPFAPAIATEDPTLAHIPPERLAPTYQNRLRSIGRQLDVYGYHSVTIMEVEGGFLVRAQRQRVRQPLALEFPDRDFPRLVASAIHEELAEDEKSIHQSDLTPTGYEDVLRAIGYRLDQISAQAIVLSELEEMFVIGGRGNDELSAVSGMSPFSIFLKAEDVDLMLNEAFRRRGQMRPKISRPAPAQSGLRGLLKRLN